MHLPLIDLPKRRRSARPRYVAEAILSTFCLLGIILLRHHSAPPQIVMPAPVVPEASPVKYVTVTIWKGSVVNFDEMPLMQLYKGQTQHRCIEPPRR